MNQHRTMPSVSSILTRVPLGTAWSISALAATGCVTMKPGNVAAVEPVTSAPRVGNVFLFRGIVGVFSTGLNQLGQQINDAGVHADVFQDDQWSRLAEMLVQRYQRRDDAEPLVLVGHSWGADHILEIAHRLDRAHIPVALILTIDPVTPPLVPSNVKACENLYQSNGIFDALPLFRGVPLKAADSSTTLVNYNLHDAALAKTEPALYEPSVGHFSIEKQQAVHAEIIKQILAVCPTRQRWESEKRGLLVNAVTTQPVRSIASAQ